MFGVKLLLLCGVSLLCCYCLLQVESREGESGGTVPRIQYYRLVNETSASPVERNQSIYSWQYGEYSDCSVTCGIGKHQYSNNIKPKLYRIFINVYMYITALYNAHNYKYLSYG